MKGYQTTIIYTTKVFSPTFLLKQEKYATGILLHGIDYLLLGWIIGCWSIHRSVEGLHLHFLSLFHNDLPWHHFQQEIASIPYGCRDLEQLERHVQFVRQEYRDRERGGCHSEHGLEQNIHEQAVLITEQSTKAPPQVVGFLCFFREFSGDIRN